MYLVIDASRAASLVRHLAPDDRACLRKSDGTVLLSRANRELSLTAMEITAYVNLPADLLGRDYAVVVTDR